MSLDEAIRGHFRDSAVVRKAIVEYFATVGEGFTGSQFETICDASRPNQFTASDFIAVSTLSVEIPPRSAIYLLSDEGVERTEALLAHVPTNLDLWDVEAGPLVAKDGPMWQLWDLVRRASWPTPEVENGHNNVGRTKASKLLAAKRPRLVPIQDQVVVDALGDGSRSWAAWREALQDTLLRDLVHDTTADAPNGLSLLRRIDVVVWMAHRKS